MLLERVTWTLFGHTHTHTHTLSPNSRLRHAECCSAVRRALQPSWAGCPFPTTTTRRQYNLLTQQQKGSPMNSGLRRTLGLLSLALVLLAKGAQANTLTVTST